MAFLAADDKQLQNGQQPGGQTSGGMSGVVGGSEPGATVGGQPVSSDSAGKGGAGGWTNIQAYLGANQGNKQDSANKLQSTVGTQFNQEKTQLNSQADETESKAKSEVDTKRIGQDQASQMIEKMGSQYQYPTAQAQPSNPLAQPAAPNEYAQNKTKLQGGLNAQYAGPQSFNYGLGAKTQEYGGSLGNDDTFKNLMGTLYNDAAGGYLGNGGKALQNQLDNGNEYLSSARSNLLNDYSGLSSAADSRVTGANKTIADSKAEVDANRGDLQNFLTGESSRHNSNIDSAVSGYLTADQKRAKDSGDIYWNDNALNNAKSNGYAVENTLGNGGGGFQSDAFGKKAINVDQYAPTAQLNSQVANETGGFGLYDPAASAKLAGSRDAFYDPSMTAFQKSNASRESKGIADADRNQYNAILDALGMNAGVINQKDGLDKGKYETADSKAWNKYQGMIS